MSCAFARNFISSLRFEWFFHTFSQPILSNLKHLRLCHLHLKQSERSLNSFGQLEKLDIIRFGDRFAEPGTEFELNLPMLTSLQLEEVWDQDANSGRTVTAEGQICGSSFICEAVRLLVIPEPINFRFYI